MHLFRNLAGFALALVLFGGVAAAQNEDVPLGDVARQQSGKKATKTYDDDNFQRTAPPPSEAKADTAKPEAKAGGEADAAPTEDVKALEKEVAELRQKRDVTTTQITRLQASIQSAGDGDIRDSLTQNQTILKQRLDEINGQLPALEKKLEAARAAQKPESGEAEEEGSKPADAKPEEKSK